MEFGFLENQSKYQNTEQKVNHQYETMEGTRCRASSMLVFLIGDPGLNSGKDVILTLAGAQDGWRRLIPREAKTSFIIYY